MVTVVLISLAVMLYEVSPVSLPPLFISEGSSVFYVHPKSVGVVSELPLFLGEVAISKVSCDCESKTLYIAQLKPPAINAVNLTSLEIWELVTSDLVFPEDLAFDWMSNNLYWVDSSKETVEVVSADGHKRVTLLKNIPGPTALAISRTGHMFIASTGVQAILMYDMDGKNKRTVYSSDGSFPMSITVHPTRSLLYWCDLQSETIFFKDYASLSTPHVLVDRVSGILSVAATEDNVYWTVGRELYFKRENSTFVIKLPGQNKESPYCKVTYAQTTTEASECQLANGGCSYLCLSSPTGRACVCPAGMKLSHDNVTCIAAEHGCGEAYASCGDGQCIPKLWLCDGESDCGDAHDEIACDLNVCNSETELRCDNGQCVPMTWACDYQDDCLDGSDEKNCTGG